MSTNTAETSVTVNHLAYVPPPQLKWGDTLSSQTRKPVSYTSNFSTSASSSVNIRTSTNQRSHIPRRIGCWSCRARDSSCEEREKKDTGDGVAAQGNPAIQRPAVVLPGTWSPRPRSRTFRQVPCSTDIRGAEATAGTQMADSSNTQPTESTMTTRHRGTLNNVHI